MNDLALKTLESRELRLNTISLRGFYGKKLRKGSGGGSGDGFPVLPGDVTRWHFGGLTNEMMAAMDDPRLEDADGKGRFLSVKNFAWGGMSGVGGYNQNFNTWVKSASRIDATVIGSSVFKINAIRQSRIIQLYYQSGGSQQPFTIPAFVIKVSGLIDNQKLRYQHYKDGVTAYFEINVDGIYNLPSFEFLAGGSVYGFIFDKIQESCDITIEILPLYPGALVFDGVDDYGICDNFPILTKEKGYTVVALRQWLSPETKTINEVLLGNFKNNPIWTSVNLAAFQFEVKYNISKIVQTNSFGIGNNITLNNNHLFSYQISNSYNGSILSIGNSDGGNFFTVGCGGDQFYSNAAIWELVFLDHDATEEELTKIKDYFVKTYPWLFFDQAWTVTGKTNEDEDRATIANITGNGNDLVLSNFGFAEGSGYGLYGENYNGGRWVKSTDRADITCTSYSVNVTSVKIASTQLYYQSYPEQPSFTVPSYVIKVYGLKDGQTLSYRQATSEGQQIYKISEDGIYTLPSFLFKANGDWYGFTLNKVQESCDITIEQIPEYEGYLVTDGVDDKITSSAFEMGEDFTVVGDWKMLPVSNYNYAGIVKSNNLYVYNSPSIGLTVFIRSNSIFDRVEGIKSLKAICSDGRVYGEDWTEYKLNSGTTVGANTALNLGFNGSNFTQMAFKNLGIYNNQLLSKDDCIKAYNYLQTLKAK